MTDQMTWLFISADPQLASHAEQCGVQRIFLDMEVRGKAARQGHLDTHRARHTYRDVAAVRAALTHSEVMVRVNPPHDATPSEVAQAVASGAQRLMLPMFTTPEQVIEFRREVPPEIPITFLAETPAALARTGAWLPALAAGDEVHFGLNDLSLGMSMDFLFEPLAGGLLDGAATALRRAGIPFGIGGIARAVGGELPAAWVLGEHARLGSRRVILSRAFRGTAPNLAQFVAEIDLAAEMAALRQLWADWLAADPAELAANHDHLARQAFSLGAARRNRA